jgi:hypothetical protein
MHTPPENQHHSHTDTDSRADLDPGSWKVPVKIDDTDLTFDGKPLNLLYEENQRNWIAKHHVFEDHRERGRPWKRNNKSGAVSEHFFLFLHSICDGEN